MDPPEVMGRLAGPAFSATGDRGIQMIPREPQKYLKDTTACCSQDAGVNYPYRDL